MNDFKGLPGISGEVRKRIDIAKQTGEGFVNMLNEEGKNISMDIEKCEQIKNWRNLFRQKEENDEEETEEETEEEPAMWTLEKFDEVFKIAHTLKAKMT